MKKISILVPTYQEEENVIPLSEELVRTLDVYKDIYDYEIVFIDNCSKDGTRKLLRELCAKNPRIKAIFNVKNFGQANSPYYGLLQTTGDCSIMIGADFQEPVSLIPSFISEWEKGAKVVCGIKTSSKENPILYFIRSLYYKAIKKMSEVEQIEHFTGFGLYDRSFIELLKKLKDPAPFLRGMVAEYASDRADLPYVQEKRRAGKSSYNWYRLYDLAMLSFTSYTKIGQRMMTLLGAFFSLIFALVALVYLILKLIYWEQFSAGIAPILIGVFLMGSLQMLFIGMLGEYILSINTRIINRPLVIEEQRINFDVEGNS